VRERFVVGLHLLAADHQLAVLFGDAELLFREAGHRQCDAQRTVVERLDILRRAGNAACAGGAFQQPFQMVEAQQIGAAESGVPVHVQPLL